MTRKRFGGSGEFIYLILLQKTSNGLRHVDYLAVGDRIKSISFESQGSKIIFNYNSHHQSQAMVEEPFVSTKLEFEILDNKFIEGLKYFNTSSSDIIVEKPKINSDIESVFDVNFKAKGWLFENSSLIKVISDRYENLNEAQASSVDGNWMVSNLVDIKAQLNVGAYKGKAKVILEADNPSGLPEKDKKVEFWVHIK